MEFRSLEELKQLLATCEEESIRPLDELEPGVAAAYTVNDNSGFIVLSMDQIDELSERGYVEDYWGILFHPDHWRPVQIADRPAPRATLHGYDSAIAALTPAADEWGVKRHLWPSAPTLAKMITDPDNWLRRH